MNDMRLLISMALAPAYWVAQNLERAMYKKISTIALLLFLTGCVTQGRDDFYASIDDYLQKSQSCNYPNGFIECSVPLLKKTLEPAWVNYAGEDGIFPNFYTRVEEVTTQRNSGHIDAQMADIQYKKAISALLAAIEARDTARVRKQQRIASAFAGFAQTGSYNGQNSGYAVTDNRVYREDECIGPVIMGRCHGSVIDKGGYHPTCHGEWLNGQCTGPLF